MKTKEYYFDLPQELIAQIPLEKRDASRMLMVSKETGEIEHLYFHQITEQLKEGDILVLNNSRVLPARIYGKKSETGGKIEVLLLERQEKDDWKCLVKPGKKMKVGSVVEFDENFSGEVIRILEDGVRLIRFSYSGIFEERLDALGEMPLPPYIHEQLSDKERYQTVYSKEDGSAAAPTAGLHFTESLLEELRKKNIQIAYVTLHVGLGTFRPVQVEDVLEHKMHSEFYTVDEKNAEIISQAKKDGRRVIAVGTTSTRTLESIYQRHKEVVASSGWTDIFIYPGYQFGVIDGLVTNFHLPESTLIMLVSAFLGKENTMNAYQTAVKEKYRFFSFGDAMFII